MYESDVCSMESMKLMLLSDRGQMASAIEAMGMSLPYSSSLPAEDPLKRVECRLAGRCDKSRVRSPLKLHSWSGAGYDCRL